MTKILILGSGGREHAFAWKLNQSPLAPKVYVAPGNAGTAIDAINLDIAADNFPALEQACVELSIDLVIVGPEDPLVKGVRNFFEASALVKHIPVVGPDAAGAQLEGSKDFSKTFMKKHQIPTADSATFTKATIQDGMDYLDHCKMPIVLKADGLAAGKGVIIANNVDEAKVTLTEMLVDAKFGDASSKVVIETFLKGIELSVFVLTDGKNYKILPEAKDYKRIGEGDTGLNTGGMGAVSPVPFANAKFMDLVENRIVKPTLNGLIAENIKYVGFIFIGLMNCDGEPFVIEYNARMGDPETEVVLPRIESDFVELMLATGNGTLNEYNLQISPETAVTTVLVAGGYPEEYTKGYEISQLDIMESGMIFHAGTKVEQGKIVTNGGRVLAITGISNSLEGAIAKSQKVAKQVAFEGKYYRKDIGLDVLRAN